MGCIVTSGLKVDPRPFAPMLSFSRPCWVPPAVPPCNQFVLRSVSYCRRRRRLLVGVWSLSALGPCGVVIVGSYIHFTCWTVFSPCTRALCLSMLRWFPSKGTARRRDCASMRVSCATSQDNEGVVLGLARIKMSPACACQASFERHAQDP